MAFKSVKDYNEERYGGLFLLRNDGDYADVVFLYQSIDDVLVCDAHYVKSPDYTGYIHCCGHGCPACGKGLRVQTKLFIPLYNITDGEVQFWDRNVRFEYQLNQDVFASYPNPSEVVFRITRHGAAGDMNTTYQIQALGRNSKYPYLLLCAQNKMTFPDKYSDVIKEFDIPTVYDMLNTNPSHETSGADSLPDYSVTPRKPANAHVAETVQESMNKVPDLPDYDENTAGVPFVPTSVDDSEAETSDTSGSSEGSDISEYDELPDDVEF